MPSSYFGPAFIVQVNGAGLAADILKNITDLSVDTGLDTPDHFSLTLVNAYPAMRWTHKDDANLFREGNAVTIQMGYVDNLQPMFDGEITTISPTFPESGTPTMRIEGYARSHRLQGSTKTRTFQNVTDKQIAVMIAQDAGFTPDAQETQPPRPYVIQFNQTDWAFVLGLAVHNRFEVRVEGKRLIFQPAGDNQSPIYTLAWGQTLKSFNPTMDTLRQVSQVTVRGYDLNKKVVLPALQCVKIQS